MGQMPGAPPWLGAGAMKNPRFVVSVEREFSLMRYEPVFMLKILDTHDNSTTRSGPHTEEELRALLKIYQMEGVI